MEPPEKTANFVDGQKPDAPELVEPQEAGEKREMLVVKLADGKERKFQHISATSFWGPDGKPMSAAQFVESLFGVLPALFKDEAELRTLWSDPVTRKKLLAGLADRGFDADQLDHIRMMVEAEASDLFDVLAYVAYLKTPETRAERVTSRRDSILNELTPAQSEFLDFVLSQYVAEGEAELDTAKLPSLLGVKYGSSPDGVEALGGNVKDVQRTFRGFQERLYAPKPPE